MADNFFCLDIGESFIKVADAKINNNSIDIQALLYDETEKSFFSSQAAKIEENQAEKIRKLISTAKITKKNTAVIIPDSFTYSQILEMPRLNEKELISAIKYQADQFVPMPIDEASIDIEIINENDKEKKLLVLMVAAPKKIVDKVQRTVELAGLIPESLENELSATARFLSSFAKNLFTQKNNGVCVINLGYQSTSLYYFYPQTSLVLKNHTFNIGYSLFIKELEINLGVDEKKSRDILSLFTGQKTSSIDLISIISPLLKEFAFEVNRFINLIKEVHHDNISQIYLINDGFRFAYLPLYLQEYFSIPASLFNPYSIMTRTPIIENHKNTLPLFIATIGGNFR